MKICLSLIGLAAAALLSGCGAAGSFPDASENAAQVSPGGFTVSNFGGHAPIVGAHLYLLQAGTSGYGSKATSLLTGGGTTAETAASATSPGYIVGSAASPARYVVSDQNGNVSISGDYTCTPGLPVYIYAYGGQPDVNPAVPASTLTSGSEAYNGTNTVATFNTVNNLFYPGQTVTFAGISGPMSAFNGVTGIVSSTGLSNTSFQVVLGTGSITVPQYTYAAGATASPVANSVINNPAIVNMAMLGNCPTTPPFTFGYGSTKQINYLYMNEVSTAAMAFAMAPFAQSSTVSGGVTTVTYTDAQHIGIPAATAAYTDANGVQHAATGDTLALTGIENAANNAGQMYDIQGSNTSTTTTDGEAHIARSVVPGSGLSIVSGTGTVPQALIDTLGNILASCVDSNNTAGQGQVAGSTVIYDTVPSPATAAYSTACNTLFLNATRDGSQQTALNTTTSSTNTVSPTDTATAAIYMAQHPAANVATLFTLPNSQTAPFQPALTTVPQDFAIGIVLSVGSPFLSASYLPNGIAIDAAGDAIVTSTGCSNGCAIEFTPLQLVNNIAFAPGATAVAIDPSNRIWVVNNSNTTASSGNGTSSSGTFFVSPNPLTSTSFVGYTNGGAYYSSPNGIAIDGNGVAYISDSTTNIHKVTALGAAPAETEGELTGTPEAGNASTNCETGVSAIAVDNASNGGNIWTSANGGNTTYVGICEVSNVVPSGTTATLLTQHGGVTTVDGIAVDYNGNGWLAGTGGGDIEQFPQNSGVATGAYSITGGGGIGAPVGIAIDGNDNIWTANTTSGNNNVSEFKNGGTATGQQTSNLATPITPAAGTGTVGGYTAGGTMSTPTQIAIDPSGDVWVTNQGNGTVTELIGIAAPTYTPLSVASKNNALGAKP